VALSFFPARGVPISISLFFLAFDFPRAGLGEELRFVRKLFGWFLQFLCCACTSPAQLLRNCFNKPFGAHGLLSNRFDPDADTRLFMVEEGECDVVKEASDATSSTAFTVPSKRLAVAMRLSARAFEQAAANVNGLARNLFRANAPSVSRALPDQSLVQPVTPAVASSRDCRFPHNSLAA